MFVSSVIIRFSPFVQTHYYSTFESRRKNRRRRPGAIGLIAVRTWPPAMRTAPRRKRSTGWMARPTQTHLDTVDRPFGVHLRVCLKQNYGFESKVSRGRNPGSPSPPYCDVPRPRENLSERAG